MGFRIAGASVAVAVGAREPGGAQALMVECVVTECALADAGSATRGWVAYQAARPVPWADKQARGRTSGPRPGLSRRQAAGTAGLSPSAGGR